MTEDTFPPVSVFVWPSRTYSHIHPVPFLSLIPYVGDDSVKGRMDGDEDARNWASHIDTIMAIKTEIGIRRFIATERLSYTRTFYWAIKHGLKVEYLDRSRESEYSLVVDSKSHAIGRVSPVQESFRAK